MANINDTDTFLVNRNNTSYQLEAQNLMADLKDNDLMLVNRNGQSYQATGADIKLSIKPIQIPPVISDVSLTEVNPDALPRFTDQDFNITTTFSSNGDPLSYKEISAYVEGNNLAVFKTDNVKSVSTLSATGVGPNANWYPEATTNPPGNICVCPVTGELLTVNNFGGTNGVWALQDPGKNWDYRLQNTVAYGLIPTSKGVVMIGGLKAYFSTNGFRSTVELPSLGNVSMSYWFYDKKTEKIFFGQSSGVDYGITSLQIIDGVPSPEGIAPVVWTKESKTSGIGRINDTLIWITFNDSTRQSTIYESYDDGVNWEEVGWPQSLNGYRTSNQTGKPGPCSLQMIGDTMYMGVMPDTDTSTPSSWHLFKTTDGRNWTQVGSSIQNNQLNYSFTFVTHAGVMYFGDSVSADLGQTWTPLGYDQIYSVDSWRGGTYLIARNNVGARSIWGSTGTKLVDTKVLEFDSSENLDKFVENDLITQNNTNASSLIKTIDLSTNKIELGAILNGSFGTNNYVQSDYKVAGYTRNYLDFDSSGNVTDLLSSPQTPPYTTTATNPSLTLKFPSTFSSNGMKPDFLLKFNSALTASVIGYNEGGVTGPLTERIVPTYSENNILKGMSITYRGSGVEGQRVNTGIDLVTNNGLLWIKYIGGRGHVLYDTKTGLDRYFRTNGSSNIFVGVTQNVQGFTQTGFIIGNDPDVNNTSGYQQACAWTFVEQQKYFDIAEFNASPSDSTHLVQHTLGCEPGFIFMRNKNSSFPWQVYNDFVGPGKYLVLNDSNGVQNQDFFPTRPTSTTFEFNDRGQTGPYVAYLFAKDEENIQCGEFTGGPSGAYQDINLPFKPQWVMVRCVTGSDWWIWNRGFPLDRMNQSMAANTQSGPTLIPNFEFKDDGFRFKPSSPGQNHLYMAIRCASPEEIADSQITSVGIGDLKTSVPEPADASELFVIEDSE